MKKFYSDNEGLKEILVNEGINLMCNDDMEIEISDNDARRIRKIVEEKAPEAIDDYVIETPWSELNYEQRRQIMAILKDNQITSGEDAVISVREDGNFKPFGVIDLDDPDDLKESYDAYISE